MPRKRMITDEELLDHALLVLREAGPDGLTFGAVAKQAGLAASTIVQRFGSKPALLRSALLRAWDRLDDDTVAAVGAAGRGAKGVIDLLVRLSGQYEASDYADQLRILREDLRDPVLVERGRAWFGVLAESIEARVTGISGMLVLAQWQGTVTIWSFTREASIEKMVRRNLTDLLASSRR
jgi:AcrR family transcriptional regulator